MYQHRTIRLIRPLVAVTFFIMILINMLANLVPLFGITTGEVSDAYPNLFAPAGFTFSIWGLIYFLLFAHTLYQLWLNQRGESALDIRTLDIIGVLFCCSSIANALWIVCWHKQWIPVAMVLMAAILICIATIVRMLHNRMLTRKEITFILIPFSVYFGWISVATIANMTTLLVYLGWGGFGLSADVWMMIISVAGALMGAAVVLMLRSATYGLVFVWAYAGILFKHISSSGFGGAHTGVIIILSICIALLSASIGLRIMQRRSRY